MPALAVRVARKRQKRKFIQQAEQVGEVLDVVPEVTVRAARKRQHQQFIQQAEQMGEVLDVVTGTHAYSGTGTGDAEAVRVKN